MSRTSLKEALLSSPGENRVLGGKPLRFGPPRLREELMRHGIVTYDSSVLSCD